MNRPTSISKRAESLRKMAQNKLNLEPMSPLSLKKQIPLQRVIDEVLKHLIDIIEILLLEQNTNNYINFMKKSQEMYEELQKKMTLKLDEKVEELKQEMIMKESVPTKVKRTDTNTLLKHERKNITQSILTHHRTGSLNLMAQHKSQELLKTCTNLRQFSEIQEQSQNDKTLVNSIDIHSISARITDLEHNQSLNLKDFCLSLERKIEQNHRDIEGLTQKHVEFKLKYEQKLETNLEALWNVVTDLKNDIPNLK